MLWSFSWESTEVILGKKAQQFIQGFLSDVSSYDGTAGLNPFSISLHSSFSSIFKMCFHSKSSWKLKCFHFVDFFHCRKAKGIKRSFSFSVCLCLILPHITSRTHFMVPEPKIGLPRGQCTIIIFCMLPLIFFFPKHPWWC